MEDANTKEDKIIDNDIQTTEECDDMVVEEEEGDVRKIIKKLKDNLKVCETERQQYLDGWQRARADYINLKKDEEKKIAQLEPYLKEKIFLEILPIADNFDMAFGNKEAWEKVDKNWRVGIEGIYNNLQNIFDSLGFKYFGEKGDKFNPEEYQAMDSVEIKEKESDGLIIDVIQKGYKFKEKVVRPSKVKVGIYKENNSPC